MRERPGSVSGLENFAIWTLHPGYRDEFFAIAHALNGRWRSSAVSSHNKAARMASFCFAWWIFHIISNPFNCSGTAKRVAKAMKGAKAITHLRFAIFCFVFIIISRQNSSPGPGLIFSYEPKAKFVPVSGPARSTGLIWRGRQSLSILGYWSSFWFDWIVLLQYSNSRLENRY